MFLKKITLVNFKNFENVEAAFSPKINCFTGLNGIGKTNLLDAIHYTAFCKSYFNTIDQYAVQHNTDFFVIQSVYERLNKDENIYCGYKVGKKKIFKRNDKEYEKLSEHIGLLPVVMISPDDSVLISGGSEERRRYIDSVISQYDRDYLQRLIRYNKVLMQRNKFLKDYSLHKSSFTETLEIYDEQLAADGQIIFQKRVDFISKLTPVFEKYYKRIAKKTENISINYKSQLFESDFKSLLNSLRAKDLMLEYTSGGIHKDDLALEIGEHSIRKTGSQGQQKTFLTALKFSQYEFISQISGLKPVLLLDDIFDKLDAERVLQIVELVSEAQFGQIFITDTNAERVKKLVLRISGQVKIFEISEKKITVIFEKNH